jgi:hypothetical protein
MEKENDLGFIEYKRFIKYRDIKRLKSLTSQMRFRLREGNGNTIYNIGVNDDGSISNISDEDYIETIKNIELMCIENLASIIYSKKVILNNTYYYEIKISDVITDNEYRVLNINNKKSLEIIGIDNNNNILSLDENTIYDIKKNSKTLVYIQNIKNDNTLIIKSILSYKPHFINYINDCNLDIKLLNIINKLNFKIINYKNLEEKIIDIIKEEPINFRSKNKFNIFQVLYNGNILNNSKIYACITNDSIENINSLYIHYNDISEKLIINDIQHFYQSVSKINNNKLISISTINHIKKKHHICNNLVCECNISYIDEIDFKLNENIDENIFYNGYYKNNILKIKINDNKIKLNKKIYTDEKYIIIDLIDQYVLINLY